MSYLDKRFRKNDFVIEKRYLPDKKLLKNGMTLDCDEITVLVPICNLKDDLSQNLIFLSGVGERMWQLIAEQKTGREIVDIIMSEYEVGRKQVQQDLVSLIQHWEEHNTIIMVN